MSRRKSSHAAEEHPDERWVISYADLVTLLLGFFIILYATADANQVKMEALARGLSDAFNVGVKESPAGSSILDDGTGIIPGANDASLEFDLDEIQRLIEAEAAAAGLTGQILVSRDHDHIVIRLADNLVFPSASADIRPQAVELLAIVSHALALSEQEIRIEGHTDNIPISTPRYPSNWELSSARATAVLRVLTDRLGVDPSRMFAAGFAEQRPIASNLTPEGRALNRRADIVLLYPAASIEGDGSGAAGQANGQAGASTSGNGAGGE